MQKNTHKHFIIKAKYISVFNFDREILKKNIENSIQ